jgi:hypothetical protein
MSLPADYQVFSQDSHDGASRRSTGRLKHTDIAAEARCLGALEHAANDGLDSVTRFFAFAEHRPERAYCRKTGFDLESDGIVCVRCGWCAPRPPFA